MKKTSLFVTGLAGILLLLAIDYGLLTKWRKELHTELESVTRLYHDRLEDAVILRVNAVESLVALFTMHPDTTLDEFETFSAHIFRTVTAVRALQFADSKTTIKYTFPSKGNEILIEKPLTLLSDPRRGPFVTKAISERSTTVQGPFQLRQGGIGIVVRSPVFINGTFLGLAIGVYDIGALIDNVFAGLDLKRLSFSLKEEDGHTFYGKKGVFSSTVVSHVRVADTVWEMTIGWKRGAKALPNLLRIFLWSCGLSLLVSVILLIQKSISQKQLLMQEVARRTKELVTSNQALSGEVAERKRVEAKLLESEKRYDIAMSASQDGLYDWDLTDNHVYYSPGWKKMLGYQDHELTNNFSVWEQLTRPEDVAEAWEMLKELTSRKRDRFEMEFKMRHKDDHWVDILSRARAIFDDTGHAERIIGTHVDISRQKRAEAELQEKSDFLNKVIETAALSMWISDEKGTALKANPACLRLFGAEEEEVIGKYNLFKDQELRRKGFTSQIRRVFEEGTTADIVIDYDLGAVNHVQVKNATHKIINSIFTPIKDSSGQVANVIIQTIDLTHIKRIENQLIQAQKMESIGTLAGGIAHEFNNMLTIIIGNNELILDEIAESSSIFESAREVRVASLRARDVVKQLLTFSRQDGAKKKIIDPKTELLETIKLIRSSTPSSIKVEYELAEEIYPISANPTQLSQLLINMCNNGIDAVPDQGGMIEISLSNVALDETETRGTINLNPGHYVKLVVNDNGAGMEKKILDRIFDPYFTTKEVGKGSGIGLAVVHGIVEQHGGAIIAESQPGKGTRLTTYFPRYTGSLHLTGRNEKSLPTGSETILFVDDEPALVTLGKRLLESLGYTVFATTDPGEALTRLADDPGSFDLVITDMTMPEMSGDQLLVEILKFRSDIGTIICTGYSSRLSETEAKELGAGALITKPLKRSELAAVVRRVLDKIQANAQIQS